MKAARLAVYEARKMTAKKAQTRTMILLVVPFGFSMGTELLKTIPHSSHTDFPIVKVGPPGSSRQDLASVLDECYHHEPEMTEAMQ